MTRDDPIVRIRLPRDVKDWLVARAKQNMRSQGAEVAVTLREKMEAETQPQK